MSEDEIIDLLYQREENVDEPAWDIQDTTLTS